MLARDLVRSGDSLEGLEGSVASVPWLEARDAAETLLMPRTSPTQSHLAREVEGPTEQWWRVQGKLGRGARSNHSWLWSAFSCIWRKRRAS